MEGVTCFLDLSRLGFGRRAFRVCPSFHKFLGCPLPLPASAPLVQRLIENFEVAVEDGLGVLAGWQVEE